MKKTTAKPLYTAYYRTSSYQDSKALRERAAQQRIVHSYAKKRGGIDREFQGMRDSVSHKDSPVLKNAIAHCKTNGTTLLLGHLDKLETEVSLLMTLHESGVNFVFACVPRLHTQRSFTAYYRLLPTSERIAMGKSAERELAE